MTAGRLITVTVRERGSFDQQGEFTPGKVTFQGELWCERRDLDQEQVFEQGGTTTLVNREWLLYWDDRIYDAAIDRLPRVTIADDGITFTVTSIVEDDTRPPRFKMIVSGTHDRDT